MLFVGKARQFLLNAARRKLFYLWVYYKQWAIRVSVIVSIKMCTFSNVDGGYALKGEW
jgi:hypothetical protein